MDIEDDLVKPDDEKLMVPETPGSEKWPAKGQVEFKNVTMRYRETLEPSIKELSIMI